MDAGCRLVLVCLFLGNLLALPARASEPSAAAPTPFFEAESALAKPAEGADPAPLAVTYPIPSNVSNPTTNSSGQYTVSWSGAADTFTIQEKRDAAAWAVVASNIWVESFAFSNKTNGTYQYRVRACNEGTCGSYSSPGPVLTVTLAPPTVSFAANPTAIGNGQSSNLTWSSTNAATCTLDGAAIALAGSQSTGALSASRTYNLSCSNGGGSTPASATVSVVPPPAVNFSADATTIGVNQGTTLRWTTSNASSCTLDGVGVAINGSQSTGALSSNRTYNLSCSGIGGSTPRSVAITVVPAPTVNFSADSTTIGVNQNTTLRWTTSNASSCTLDGVGVAINGSQSTGALTGNRTYNLSCSSIGGSTPRSVSITVIPAPALSLTVDQNPIGYNQSTTLRWTSTNASSCTLNGVNVPVSGSQSTGTLIASKAYTFVCSGIGGSDNKALTVTVVPPPTASLTADAYEVPINGSTMLRWSSTNASSCTLNSVGVATGGAQSTGALSSSTLFTLNCLGLGGNQSKAVTVTPVASPIVTLAADVNPVAENASTTLRWISVNAASCTLNGSSVSISGNANTGTLTAAKLFTVACTGSGGNGSRQLTVDIVPLTQIWKNIGQCDVQTGKLTQLCVDSRFCTVNSLQQVDGGCQQAVGCGS